MTYINLREKPDWFLEISPHGKVPVLIVDEIPLFESNAIAEFLDEVTEPRLHPSDAVERAKHRAWTDYVPTFSGLLGKVYYCKDVNELPGGMDEARVGLRKLEEALEKSQVDGAPYFSGSQLCLVDAAYAPFFQLFQMVEDKLQSGLLNDFPRVRAWAQALADNPAVNGSVVDSFNDEYVQNLKRRGAYASELFDAA